MRMIDPEKIESLVPKFPHRLEKLPRANFVRCLRLLGGVSGGKNLDDFAVAA